MDFINTGIDMTESERKEYAARGKLHATIVEFFYGVDRERKNFAEQKERAMKAAEEDMNKILEERRKNIAKQAPEVNRRRPLKRNDCQERPRLRIL